MLNIVLNGRSLYPIPDKPEPVTPPIPDFPVVTDLWTITDEGDRATLATGTHNYLKINASSSTYAYSKASTTFTNAQAYNLSTMSNDSRGIQAANMPNSLRTSGLSTPYYVYDCIGIYPCYMTGNSSSAYNGWYWDLYQGDASQLDPSTAYNPTYTQTIKDLVQEYGYFIIGPNAEVLGWSATYVNMSQYIPPEFYVYPDPIWDLAPDKSTLTMKAGLYRLDRWRYKNNGGGAYFELSSDLVMKYGYAESNRVSYMTQDYSANIDFEKKFCNPADSITQVELKVTTSSSTALYLGNYDWDDKVQITKGSWMDFTTEFAASSSTEGYGYALGNTRNIFGTSSSKGYSFPIGSTFEIKHHFSNDSSADIYTYGVSSNGWLDSAPYSSSGATYTNKECYICDANGNRVTALDSYITENTNQSGFDINKIPGNLLPVGGYLYYKYTISGAATTGSYYYSRIGESSYLQILDNNPASSTIQHMNLMLDPEGNVQHMMSAMQQVDTYPTTLSPWGYFNLALDSNNLLSIEDITSTPKYYNS